MSDLNRRLNKLEVIWKRRIPDRPKSAFPPLDPRDLTDDETREVNRIGALLTFKPDGRPDFGAIGDDDLDFLAHLAYRSAMTSAERERHRELMARVVTRADGSPDISALSYQERCELDGLLATIEGKLQWR